MKLKMTEDHCCGGGHCGPVPGYDFHCPFCDKDTGCRTGTALKEGRTFKCMSCRKAMIVDEVLEVPYFEVSEAEVEASN